MHPFVAVILICLNSVAAEACDETNAADVMSNGVESELSCVMGLQDVVARSALAKRDRPDRLCQNTVPPRQARSGEPALNRNRPDVPLVRE